MDQLLSLIWGVVGTILTALATWGTTVLISWLNSKIKDTKVAAWASSVTQIVSSAVQSVMQTYVNALKKEGKFGAEEAAEAKRQALEIINNQLTPELNEYIKANYQDIEKYLNTQIEAVIYALKNKVENKQ